MHSQKSDVVLLAEYIATFEKYDDLCAHNISPLLLADMGTAGRQHWQPRPITTSASALADLYQKLGLTGHGSTRFPPLYEDLLLSYRWAEVDLGNYRLLANEPAEDLSPLLSAMRADVHLFATLVSNGYLPFGRGSDVNYDPVCFDFRQRQNNGDYRIVRLEHEAILCKGRIGTITQLAPSFRSLMLNTIERSAAK